MCESEHMNHSGEIETRRKIASSSVGKWNQFMSEGMKHWRNKQCKKKKSKKKEKIKWLKCFLYLKK